MERDEKNKKTRREKIFSESAAERKRSNYFSQKFFPLHIKEIT
jgi:hypothetical protein